MIGSLAVTYARHRLRLLRRLPSDERKRSREALARVSLIVASRITGEHVSPAGMSRKKEEV